MKLQIIHDLASISDDPVLLTTRPGFNTAEHPWIRLVGADVTPEQLSIYEDNALRVHYARGIIGNRILNPILTKRAGWMPWSENDDLTAVYETPIGLLIRLGVEGRDPRSGLDPVQFMAPALTLVQQITAAGGLPAARTAETPTAGPTAHALVLPGSCGGGTWHVHEQRIIRFTKLVLNEIPYLADVVALALQFVAAALRYDRVEIPGDCVLFANVTSRSGIFVPEPLRGEDDIATGAVRFRKLHSLNWPVEGGPANFRASLMKRGRAARLELVRFSRPETRPLPSEYGKLRGNTPQLLPSVYATLALIPPHPLRAAAVHGVRVEWAAPLWDMFWRETLFRESLRPGERPHSVESHLHVPFGLDSRIHVHDVTNTLDQLDRGRLRLEHDKQVPTRVLELTDYRHPLADSQPAAQREIVEEIETMINVVEEAQKVLPGLAVLFTRPIVATWRRMMGLEDDEDALPKKLQKIAVSTSLWRV